MRPVLRADRAASLREKGYSHQRIAEILRVPPRQVEKLLARAAILAADRKNSLRVEYTDLVRAAAQARNLTCRQIANRIFLAIGDNTHLIDGLLDDGVKTRPLHER